MKLTEIYKNAMSILDSFYPNDSNYRPQISPETQFEELKQLNQTIKYEQFYFVLDLVDKKIKNVSGLSDWLEYPNETFDIMEYLKIMHPRHRLSIFNSAISAFQLANSSDFMLKFMNQRLVAQLPLLHKNGKYYVCKRSLYPFQISDTGQIMAYLNHFVIIKEYDELDTLDLRIGNNAVIKQGFEMDAYQKGLSIFNKEASLNFGFNKKEILILEALANDASLGHAELAKLLDINLSTLKKTYNSRILNKARSYFNIESFSNIKEVAQFMRREGLF
jgi:hypothetical protein